MDNIISVSEESIALAILRILELEKSVVEGAGAVGLAAFISGELPIPAPMLSGNTILPSRFQGSWIT